jgi:hypothetical protein
MLYAYRCIQVVATWMNTRISGLRRLHHGDGERGETSLTTIVIAAALFLLAVAVGAKITQVVNDYMSKIK